MALNLGRLYVQIGADSHELVRGLSTAERSLDRFSSKVTALGRTLTLSLTTPLALIGTKAIKMAMDVTEAENLFEVSMGNMTDKARNFSKEYSKALGVNEYEMRKQMGTFKVMTESMGLTETAAYDLAEGITQLGYDIASFYNITNEEAFLKLQSGLSGETEPLKRLGIIVNETTIELWALNNGLIEQGEQLSEAGKVAARYGVILDQTKKAQGDLARTIESPTNQYRILQERVTQLVAEFGQALLPVFSEAIRLAEPLVAKLKDLVTQFRDLPEETQKSYIKLGLFIGLLGPGALLVVGLSKALTILTGAIKGVYTVIASIITFGKNLIFAFQAWAGGAATFGEALSLLVGGPVGWVILGIAALIGVGYLLIKNWKDVSHWGLQTWGKIKKSIYEAIVALNKFMESIALTDEARENYRKTVEKYTEKAVDEQETINKREAQRTLEEAEENAKDVAETVKNEVSTVLGGNFFNNLDFSLSNTALTDIKKTAQQIQQELSKNLNINSLLADADEDFDRISEDLSAYRTAIREMLEAGYQNTAEYKNMIFAFQQLLSLSKSTPAQTGLSLLMPGTMQSKLTSLSNESLEGQNALALLDLVEQINAAHDATLQAWDANGEDWTGLANILSHYQDQLKQFSALADSLGDFALGTELWMQAESFGGFIKEATLEGIKHGLDLEKAYNEAFVIGDHKTGVEAQIQAISSALSQYVSAGGEINDPWVAEMQAQIKSLKESIAEPIVDTFAEERKAIEDNLRNALLSMPLKAQTAFAKGESFNSAEYQAKAYTTAIENLQTLMLANGYTIEQVMKSTANWNKRLQQLDSTIEEEETSELAFTRIKRDLQTKLAQMPLAQSLAKALGEDFDKSSYQLDAYTRAVENLNAEMFAEGATIEEIKETTKEWRLEIAKLKEEIEKADPAGDWLKSLGENLVSKFPIVSNAYSGYSTGSKAFVDAGMGGITGGLIGALVSLLSSSETFGHILDNVNPILQAVADTLGLFLEPLLPVINVLGQTLAPILKVLGDILSSLLVPVMRPLFEGLKLVGVVANVLGAGLYGLMGVLYSVSSSLTNLAYQVFLWLPGFKGVEASLLNLKDSLDSSADDAYSKMTDMWTEAGQLSKLTWDEALEGAKGLSEVGKETAEALRNVPNGFKVALARFDATTATRTAGGEEFNSASAKQLVVNYYGDAYGFDDFKQTVTEIVKDAGGQALLTEYGL